MVACLKNGDPDYVYSAAMLAYTHLGNALRRSDPEAWARIYDSLNDAVLADFSASNTYWARFETPVQNVSNTVYEGFLYSYNQNLGLKSYGACVNLLVNYYDPIVPDLRPSARTEDDASAREEDAAAQAGSDASTPGEGADTPVSEDETPPAESEMPSAVSDEKNS